MSKYNIIKNNFTKGELDPNFIGRVETDVYSKGCALLENMLPLPQGGVTKRPGTFVLNEVTNTTSSSSSIFKEFQIYPIQVMVSTSGQSGELRLKTILVCISLSTSGIASGWIRFFNSDGTEITGGNLNSYYTKPARTIPDYATNGITLTDEIYTVGDGEEQLDFSYAQSNNVAAFTHKSGKMCPFLVVVAPSGVITWMSAAYYPASARTYIANYFPIAFPTDIRFNNNIVPFQKNNIGSVTMTPSATAVGACTITASSATFYDTTGGTWDQWQGTIIALTSSGNTGFAVIESRVSNTVVNATITVPFTAGATTNWRISAWNGYYGFPRSVTLHDQRFVWGGSPRFGDSLWNSEAGDIFHLRDFKAAQDSSTDVSNLGYFGSVADTDAFTIDMSSNFRNDVRWVYSFNDLIVGTNQGVVKVSTGGQPYAYNTVNATTQDSVGVGYCSPLQVNNVLFYTDNSNQKLLFLEKNENTGAYSSKDVTSLNYDIISAYHTDDVGVYKNSYWITQMVYLSTFKSIFMRIHNSDVLVSFSFNPSAEVTAFARHRIAPYGYAAVKSICVAPSMTEDEPTIGIPNLFLSVTRTTAGSDIGHYIEQLSTPMLNDSNIYLQPFIGSNDINNGAQSYFLGFKPSINYMDGMSTVEDVNASFPAATTFLARGFTRNSRVYDSSTVSVFGSHPSLGANPNFGDQLWYYGSLSVNASGVVNVTVTHDWNSNAGTTNSPVFYGFDYPSKIQLLPIEAGANFGTRQGSIQRTHELVLRLRSSRGFKIGKDFTTMVNYLSSKFPTAAPNYDILTDDFTLTFPGNPDNDQACIQHDIPFPFTIIAIILKGVTYD